MPSLKSELQDEMTKQARKVEAGDVESLNIQRAENGWTARVYRRPKQAEKGECVPCGESKEMVFTDASKLAAFIADALS